MLTQNQFLEVIEHEILHGISVHAIHISELVIIFRIVQSADTIWSAVLWLSSLVSWKTVYWAFSWFQSIHHYLLKESCSEEIFIQQQVLLLKKCLNYRFQNSILWYNYCDLIVTCISEEQVSSILYEAHDLEDHWTKEETLTRLRKYVYWSEQSVNVECYIKKCIHCIYHNSAI